MKPIIYIDRLSGQKKIEKVFGASALRLLYGNAILRSTILPAISKLPFFSAAYGFFQRLPSTKKKIAPFIKDFEVDATEFQEPVTSFRSFNDFFIRQLKSTARPVAAEEDKAIIPADARYYFYQNIDEVDGFVVKGCKFTLKSLLEDEKLASQYKGASMVLARLCPSDYHRFHFPCDGNPGESRLINGWLYSVNPLAIKRDIAIFIKNKRTVCSIKTANFGEVLYLEIGATNVGSIHQTYIPFQEQSKGAEKGYFSFGASSLILLFEKGRIKFDADLLEASEQGIEIRCLMGQSMGTAPTSHAQSTSNI